MAGFNDLLESFPNGVLIVNDRKQILTVNQGFETIFGYGRGEVIGKSLDMLFPGRFFQNHDHVDATLWNNKVHPLSQDGEIVALGKNGKEFPVEMHLSPMKTVENCAFVVTLRDISKLKKNEARLKYLANHDRLTGLPNRNLLADRLIQALMQAERFQQQVAVLCVDLDRFKSFLAGLSLDVGEAVLIKIADRLKTAVREIDTIARLGDDVFIIVLANLKESEDAAKVGRKIQAAVVRPIELDNLICEISCCIGISVYPKDGTDTWGLLKNAEVAMLRAKEQGYGLIQFFTDELNDRIASRMAMERCLRQAVDNQELSVHFQPKMDLRTGRMVGFEALLRWKNATLGEVSPGIFIPLAEETGLIIPIGEWVLKTACQDNKRWQETALPHLPVAINLSPRQFWDPGLVRTISLALSDSGLEAKYLELEITESMVMRDVENALTMLRELKKLGVQLAIDDFGTGYSNLSHLQRFPFDKLKMDSSFVREITHNPGCAAIAKTIIALGHNLNLRVIAEGIETEGQLSFLRLRGCDEMQGFYFSRPLSAQDFEKLLKEGRRLHFPEQSEGFLKRTLLLVDDEPKIISSMERVLREEGYKILSTTNAVEGFELLATNPVGVVLSDLRMPGMDGIEFLSRISRLHPETVRIAMSGYADMDMVTEAINRGAIYKFITKPFANEVLRQSIAKAFEQFEVPFSDTQ